jgi:hypothetical protein
VSRSDDSGDVARAGEPEREAEEGASANQHEKEEKRPERTEPWLAPSVSPDNTGIS